MRRLIHNDFKSVFEAGVDFLLTPVTLTEAIPYSKWLQLDKRLQRSVEDFCTQPVNLAGMFIIVLFDIILCITFYYKLKLC